MTFVKPPSADAPLPQCPNAAKVRTLLAACPALQGLPPAALADLARHATPRRHAACETLFHEGDPASHCLLVELGCVELLRYDAAGEERMLERFGAGALVAAAAMFLPHGRHPMTARAHTGTRVWRIPRQALHTACACHPALALCLLQALSQCLCRRENEIDWLTRSNAQQRLAGYVLALAGPGGTHVELPTSQRHLAARLGVRAETLSRLLAQWQASGWIQGTRRDWRLNDAGALRRLLPPGMGPEQFSVWHR